MTNIAAIGLYMLLTGLSGDANAIPAPEISDTNTVVISERKEESTNEIDADTEARVREYFSDIPILAEVARCESHFTHTTKSGKVLRGTVDRNDVGVMQINERYHLEESKKLNIDIYTLEGNLEYARHLYEDANEGGKGLGARPWLASAPCWAKKVAVR